MATRKFMNLVTLVLMIASLTLASTGQVQAQVEIPPTNTATVAPTVVTPPTPALTEPVRTQGPTSPWIQSDQLDYPPAAMVTLSSGGWQPGEMVLLSVNDTVGQTWQITDTVTADGTGAFPYQFQLPNWFVALYKVTATGQASGAVATTTFTDANTHVNSVGVNGPAYGVSYGVGYGYNITVTFSGNETVTGTPRIQLNTSPTRYATYFSGSGTATLTFIYTVQAGDNSALLNYSSTSALNTNGGTIKNGSNTASLTLPGLTAGTNGLYANSNPIDGNAPQITSLTVTPSPSSVAPTINVSITDNQSVFAAEYFVDVSGTAGTGTPLTVSGSSTSETASGTVATFASLADGSHTIYVDAQDAAGNWSTISSQSFIKDSVIPTVTVTGPGAPTNQTSINFTASFSVPVTGFTSSGITVTGGSVANLTGGPSVYTITVNPSQNPSPQAGEAITVQVNAGAALSVATNYNSVHDPNPASNIASATFDNVAPGLTGTTSP